MKLTKSLMTCFLLLSYLTSQQALADAGSPIPYRASYQAEYNFFLPVTGTAVRELKQDSNGAWLLTNTVKSNLLTIEESSRFDWVNGRPQPVSYRFEQKSIKNKQLWLDFDWQTLLATNTSDIKYPPYPIDVQVLDPLTYQLALRTDLVKQKPEFSYRVADKKRVDTYDFEVLGEEQLETPLGLLNTVKIIRKRDADSTRESVIWLAKDWDYLLVKIRQKERGNTFFIVMQEGELNGQPITGLKSP
jgi:hypothetical protein